MTRAELRDAISKRIAADFKPGHRNPDGSHRNVLNDYDCDHIADLVFSVVGQSGLGIYDVKAVVVEDKK